MKVRKVIFIGLRAYGAYFPTPDSEYYYLAGWNGSVARRMQRFTNRYAIENWRPEKEVDKPTACKVQGVVCRLFPSRHIRHFGEFSSTLLGELRAQSESNEILIHHSSIYTNFLYLIALLFKDIPLVAQHHGDSSSLSRFKHNRRFWTFLASLVERKILGNIDHFLVLRKSEIDILSKYVNHSRISVQTMGVDFNEFQPVNKELARKKLNLPKNKKVMLYVGKFYRLKGVDVILQAYKVLKQRFDVELVLVGGSPDNELYEEVSKSGARFHGILPHTELPMYYSAADLYMLPAFSPNYRGVDVASIESLACGTPLVSTTLRDFPTDDWRGLGRIPRNSGDVVTCVSEIFRNPSAYYGCRQTAKKYYDWGKIIMNTAKLHDVLFDRYYGE